jgi:hypothetical protein
MEVSGHHAPAALPPEKTPPTNPLNRMLGGPESWSDDLEKRKISSPCWDSNPGLSYSMCSLYKALYLDGSTARP